MYVIGIDPGKNGGIVALSGHGNNPKVIDIMPMPSTISGIWDHFVYLGFPNMIKKEETYVYIEKVHSMPTDGRRAAYTFGYHNGVLDTILTRLCSNINRIFPREWMGYFSLQKTPEESKYDFKKRILLYAKTHTDKSGVNERNNKLLHRKVLTLKTCDAYLIGLYGYNRLWKLL